MLIPEAIVRWERTRDGYMYGNVTSSVITSGAAPPS